MSTETEVPEVQTTASPLLVQTRKVHGVRRGLEALAGALKAKREAFERDNADIIGLVAAQKQVLAEEELRLRDMAVAEFKATGSTKPSPGDRDQEADELHL